MLFHNIRNKKNKVLIQEQLQTVVIDFQNRRFLSYDPDLQVFGFQKFVS